MSEKSGSDLGQLTPVNLRDHWPKEASDFTPWLAQDENLKKLGRAVGLELEVVNIEVAVGPYSADILARDTATGSYIVIENQIGKTDHDHLGKLLTYGSALDASAVIWVAGEITEEHKGALDWLNDHTSEDLGFFAVKVELWQIDDSKPAVRFNVVARPAELLSRSAIAQASGELSNARKLQLDFWIQFREKLLEEHIIPSARKPYPRYWFDISLGRTGINLSNIVNTYDGKIGVRLYTVKRIVGGAFDQLLARKEEIEEKLGFEPEWNPNPDAQDKIIAVYLDVDLDARDKWPEYIEWMTEKVRRYREVFVPIIKELDYSSNEMNSNGPD